MIIKIKSHKRPAFKRILEYMMNSKDRLFDKDRRSFAITHNLKGNTIDEWEKQYKANELCRQRKRSDSVLLTHEILSWHRDDSKNITLDMMEEMTREYIKQRNLKGIYVAVPHFDKDHYHVHICASGVEYKTGQSLRLSKPDLLKLKKEIQQYQIDHFPELSKSVVEHGKKEKSQTSDKEYQMKLRAGMATQKEQLFEILNACYAQADSKERFFELLKKSKLKVYERGGKISGVYFANNKFRFKRIGFPEERLEELNKSRERGNELSATRKKSKEKNINRNR